LGPRLSFPPIIINGLSDEDHYRQGMVLMLWIEREIKLVRKELGCSGREKAAQKRQRRLAEIDEDIALLRPHMQAAVAYYEVLRLDKADPWVMSFRTFQKRWSMKKNTRQVLAA
jgi:hypothetical protein